jgi:arylsulfatase A-like enzyme
MCTIGRVFFLFFFLIVPSLSFAQQDSLSKPNFVFILIDDLGWRDVGANGSPYYKTPNIDKISTEGAIFTDAYSNGPNCAPSRVAILTGQYAPRTGVYTVMSSRRGKSRFRKLIPIKNKRSIKSSILTFPQILSKSGYVSAIVGKRHGHGAEGFQWNFYKPDKPPEVEDNDPKNVFLYTKIAKRFIEKFKDQPFFLYLAHQAVHTPIEARQATIEKYIKKRKNRWEGHPEYGALIEDLDESIGELLNTLENLNLKEKTTVILFSDNGGNVCCSSMEPLRGAKGTMYEGAIRVPLFIRWPGQKRQGQVIKTPVSGIDLFPTILEMARIQKPNNHILDGESLIPLLLGNNNLKNRAIYWHFPAYLEAADHNKTGRWRSTPWSAIRYENYKLIEFFEDKHLELYDLKNDLGEKKNLTSIMPKKTEELYDRLNQWRISIKAPIPTEDNPDYNPIAPNFE